MQFIFIQVCDNATNTKNIIKKCNKGIQTLRRPLKYVLDLTRKIKSPIVYESDVKIDRKEIPIPFLTLSEKSKFQLRSDGRSKSTTRRDQMVDLSEAMVNCFFFIKSIKS